MQISFRAPNDERLPNNKSSNQPPIFRNLISYKTLNYNFLPTTLLARDFGLTVSVKKACQRGALFSPADIGQKFPPFSIETFVSN